MPQQPTRPDVTLEQRVSALEALVSILLRDLPQERLEFLRRGIVGVLGMKPQPEGKAAMLDYLDFLLDQAQRLAAPPPSQDTEQP
ncbi:MAG: hypothetical protein JNJ73_10300 [Hyphomonadaceae bacterium]|nr:hypothetical protein [Hyphomonadaceae bacterium]